MKVKCTTHLGGVVYNTAIHAYIRPKQSLIIPTNPSSFQNGGRKQWRLYVFQTSRGNCGKNPVLIVVKQRPADLEIGVQLVEPPAAKNTTAEASDFPKRYQNEKIVLAEVREQRSRVTFSEVLSLVLRAGRKPVHLRRLLFFEYGLQRLVCFQYDRSQMAEANHDRLFPSPPRVRNFGGLPPGHRAFWRVLSAAQVHVALARQVFQRRASVELSGEELELAGGLRSVQALREGRALGFCSRRHYGGFWRGAEGEKVNLRSGVGMWVVGRGGVACVLEHGLVADKHRCQNCSNTFRPS